MPLEVFVHGALCVAYWGQCLTSEALGQRSANRGECAQACRLPYQLIVGGQERDLQEQRRSLELSFSRGLSTGWYGGPQPPGPGAWPLQQETRTTNRQT